MEAVNANQDTLVPNVMNVPKGTTKHPMEFAWSVTATSMDPLITRVIPRVNASRKQN